ncbi:MAG: peptide chain release factor N(5)-glutamine methyltransferase [Oscillospiraceae bacterium]|nr:peptide chain release factor N(5)-glutamine methyltransferase [Oscillospiraceae bacterium]
MARTYNDLYLDMRQRLLGSGVAMASLEAREIIRHATGRNRAALARDRHFYVPPEAEAAAMVLLERRLAGEPIAYIVGEWEFFGLTFVVNPDVLIPRVDTEVLADAAIAAARACGPGARVLDLCAGSGCVGLAVAVYAAGCRVVLGDVSDLALKVARRNVRRHDLSARVACMNVDALASAPASLGAFDVLVCNPPYVPDEEWKNLDHSVRDYEPRLALEGGPDGLQFYRSVVAGWRPALRRGGRLLFECGVGQAEAVRTLLYREAYGGIETLRDTGGIERVVMGSPVWNEAIREGIAEIG